MTVYHYVIVRPNLPTGVLAAQVIHAAGESAEERVQNGTHAVALVAKSPGHLGEIESKLIRLDIPHRAIREPDPPWNNELMAIGIRPMVQTSKLRRITRGLRLVGAT